MALALSGCSGSKFLPTADSYILNRVKVSTDNKALDALPLKGYVRQRANSRWFSLLKVPLGIYSLSGRDSTRHFNHFLRQLGEAPVVYDSTLCERSCENIASAVHNLGYLDASVTAMRRFKRRKVSLEYKVSTGLIYRIGDIHYVIDDPQLRPLILSDTLHSDLHRGMPFSINQLDEERARLNTMMQDSGYFKFNKEFVAFDADSTGGNHQIDLTYRVKLFRVNDDDSATSHRRYYVDRVSILDNVLTPFDSIGRMDSLRYGAYNLYFTHKPIMRPKVLVSNTAIQPQRPFNESQVHDTYNNYGGLRAIQYSSIRFVEAYPDSNRLNCFIVASPNKTHTASVEVEGTNSAGDLGAAASLTMQNRNIFRGSELFSIKVRGAFEAITGLEGYNDQNYVELSGEMGLAFPYSDIPFLSRRMRNALRVTSELSILFDSQNRPEFHRRVLTGIWSYRWYRHHFKALHRIDLIDLNYVFMPWISDTFKRDYLENESTQNSILRYNYQDLFIMKLGYTYTYNSMGNTATSTYGKNAYAFRFNIETAGNVLYAFSHLLNQKKNDQKAFTLFNIAYAEYVKGDFDYSKSFVLDQRNSVACHVGLGIAYPYGNSSILPYEKRYFSGGANSVRGWSVRSLGPGTYSGGNGRIDFINQTGDIKLDLNAEYRTYLFWKLNGALFVDAGNIWTIRKYADQPGGQFSFNTFWKQIAVSYGLGLRFNFDYFILRLDGGMRAVNPAYTTNKEHYPIIYPHFGRDFAFHFAVGLPF